MITNKIIDIIVPIYNQANVIYDFLESATKIDKQKVNVILVNDGSKDATRQIIEEFLEHSESENFYLINKDNGGVSSARNAGLQCACSQYVWFCDPDDIILNDMKGIFPILENKLQSDVFVFSYETYNVSSDISRINYRIDTEIAGDEFLLKHNNLTHNYWYPASDGTLWDKIYKRNSISDIYFDEELVCSEDFNFNFNVFKKITKVTMSREVIYKYNIYKSGTLSSTFNEKIFNDRIRAERDTLFFLKESKSNVRAEVKKHILKNVNLLSVYSKENPFYFYSAEHEIFGEKIFPFTSTKEFLFFILSYLNVYMITIKTYRKIKKLF